MLVEKFGPDGKPELDAEGKPIMVDDGKKEEKKEGDKTVTQSEFDKQFRLRKEAEEKLEKSEKEKVGLVGTVKELEGKVKPEPKPGEGDQPKEYGRQADGSMLFPQTQEEWNDLALEDPLLATDLRIEFKSQQGKRTDTFQTTFYNSAMKVVGLLPEMYKKDADGKVLFKKGPNGKDYPVPNYESEMYKLYKKTALEGGADANGQPIILGTATGPEMVANTVVQSFSAEKKKELEDRVAAGKAKVEADRQGKVKDGQVAPPGVTPPPGPKVEIKFNSKQEKEHADKRVADGTYKNLEEYCTLRDRGISVPYGRGGV